MVIIGGPVAQWLLLLLANYSGGHLGQTSGECHQPASVSPIGQSSGECQPDEDVIASRWQRNTTPTREKMASRPVHER